MKDDEPKLILLEEFLEQRLRKTKEIEYYEDQLKEIERKLFFLRKERQLTTTIIDMLTREKIVDLQEMVEEKLLLKKPDKTDDDD